MVVLEVLAALTKDNVPVVITNNIYYISNADNLNLFLSVIIAHNCLRDHLYYVAIVLYEHYLLLGLCSTYTKPALNNHLLD